MFSVAQRTIAVGSFSCRTGTKITRVPRKNYCQSRPDATKSTPFAPDRGCTAVARCLHHRLAPNKYTGLAMKRLLALVAVACASVATARPVIIEETSTIQTPDPEFYFG